MLSPKRDVVAAKHCLQLALWRAGQVRPRVINVDGHASYPAAIRELKEKGSPNSSSCTCRHNHRFSRKASRASGGRKRAGIRMVDRAPYLRQIPKTSSRSHSGSAFSVVEISHYRMHRRFSAKFSWNRLAILASNVRHIRNDRQIPRE